VEDAAPAKGRDGTDGQAPDQPQGGRTRGQAELDRQRSPDHRGDRQLLAERVAQAGRRAMQRGDVVTDRPTEEDALDPLVVLIPERQVEAEPVLDQLLPLDGRGDLPDEVQRGRHVGHPRADEEDDEGDEACHQQYQDSRDRAANDVSDHRVSVSVAGPKRNGPATNTATSLVSGNFWYYRLRASDY